MIKTLTYSLLICSSALFAQSKNMKNIVYTPLTKAETTLIKEKNSYDPFRVLLTTSDADTKILKSISIDIDPKDPLIKLLADRYLVKGFNKEIYELPQERFMAIAMHLALVEGDNKVKYAKEFCSLLDVETPIKILFSLHFLRTDNVLLDIVLSLCNRVPSKSNKSSLHFFMSLFPRII